MHGLLEVSEIVFGMPAVWAPLQKSADDRMPAVWAPYMSADIYQVTRMPAVGS